LSVELENTLISSYSTGGGDKPIETLSLNYTKITYTTKPTSASQNAQNAKDMAIWNAVVR
jgi:type VI protein secretion system component Hcp